MKHLIILYILSCSFAYSQISVQTFNPFANGNNPFMMNRGMTPNYGFNNQQRNYGFNTQQRNYGFNNNGFNNNQQQNNGFNNNQQQGNNQTNSPQLFTRRYHLNNGYLYGRPTLWYDAKSGKMQPWVRRNLR